MSIPETPIKCFEGSIVDKDGFILMDDDIARDLTAYYTLLKRQEECGKTGHMFSFPGPDYEEIQIPVCRKCGADLTKGATHES